MITRRVFSTAVWLELVSPTRQELEAVAKEYSIDQHIINDIEDPTPYPIAMTIGSTAYLVLHFPTSFVDRGAKSQEIDFIVGKGFLITVRYENIACLYHIHQSFEAEELAAQSVRRIDGSDDLLERILRRIYRSMHEEIDAKATRLDSLEKDIFSHKEKAVVREISSMASLFMRFEKVIDRHEESLGAFLRDLLQPSFFGSEFRRRAQNIEAERSHAKAAALNYRDVSRDLRTTNISLLTSSQNEAVKRFSMLAFFTFPLSLIAAIFTMDTNKPLVDHPYAFWIIVGIMVCVTVLLLLWFKRKRWL